MIAGLTVFTIIAVIVAMAIYSDYKSRTKKKRKRK